MSSLMLLTHTAQGNRLLNVSRRMFSDARNNSDPQKKSATCHLCATSMESYRAAYTKCNARIEKHNQHRQQQPQECSPDPIADATVELDDKAKQAGDLADTELQYCQDIVEMFESVQHIKVDNFMNAPRLRRTGELHIAKEKTSGIE